MYETYPQYVIAWQANPTSVLAVKIPKGSEDKMDKLLTSKKEFRVKGKVIPHDQIIGILTESEYRNLKKTLFEPVRRSWDDFRDQMREQDWYLKSAKHRHA